MRFFKMLFSCWWDNICRSRSTVSSPGNACWKSWKFRKPVRLTSVELVRVVRVMGMGTWSPAPKFLVRSKMHMAQPKTSKNHDSLLCGTDEALVTRIGIPVSPLASQSHIQLLKSSGRPWPRGWKLEILPFFLWIAPFQSNSSIFHRGWGYSVRPFCDPGTGCFEGVWEAEIRPYLCLCRWREHQGSMWIPLPTCLANGSSSKAEIWRVPSLTKKGIASPRGFHGGFGSSSWDMFFSTIPRDPSSFFHLKRQWSAIIDEPRLRIFAFLACAQKTPPEVGNRTWVQAVSICETGMGSIKVNSYWNLMESMVPIHHCHQMWTTARVVTYESAGMMNIVGNQKRSTSNTMWFANRAWGFQAGGFSHK